MSDDLTINNCIVIDVSDSKEVSILDFSDNIAALVFNNQNGKIGSKAAEWSANALKKIEEKYKGIVILNSGVDFSNGTNIDNEPLLCVEAFQSLTTVIRHYSKPVVTLLSGQAIGFGYDIAFNSHAVITYNDNSKYGYDFSQGLSPMGGGLTAQIIDTYEKGKNVPGLDIIPFLKVLLNNVCFAKKAENKIDARAKNLLPNNTYIIKDEENILTKGKQKALNMFNEGFEPIPYKTVEAAGTTGTAALEAMIINMHEGLFIPDSLYNIALKTAEIIGGGNVPKKTPVSEQQLLNLEKLAIAHILDQKRNEVAK